MHCDPELSFNFNAVTVTGVQIILLISVLFCMLTFNDVKEFDANISFSGPVHVGMKKLHALCAVISALLKQSHMGVSVIPSRVNIASDHAQSQFSQKCCFTCVGFVNI